MIVEYIRYRIPADQAAAFEDAYRAASASLDTSPHCQRYEFARCTEDPSADGGRSPASMRDAARSNAEVSIPASTVRLSGNPRSPTGTDRERFSCAS
jgi:hypothetical protein